MHNLRALRKQNGITMKHLANVLGVSESTISMYETGKREPDRETLCKLADFFHVTIDYIVGRASQPQNNGLMPITPYVKLAKLGATAAGSPIYDRYDESEWEYADAKYGDEQHYFLDVIGDSMTPTIPNGSRVIIRKQDYAEYDGQIVAACVDGENITIKRYYAISSGDVLLKADNPSAQSYVMTKHQIESGEARILGVAVEYKKVLI